MGVQPTEIALTHANQPPARVAFDALFQEHYPRVVAVLARLVGDRGQAEEIASDVFCKVALRGPQETEGLLPWVYRVATNAGLDAVRSNSRRRRREEIAGSESRRTGITADALDGILRQEQRARVRAVLGTLKPRDAELLLLRAEGLPYRELAEALGVQPGSVGTLLARAESEFERRFRARYGEQV